MAPNRKKRNHNWSQTTTKTRLFTYWVCKVHNPGQRRKNITGTRRHVGKRGDRAGPASVQNLTLWYKNMSATPESDQLMIDPRTKRERQAQPCGRGPEARASWDHHHDQIRGLSDPYAGGGLRV
jgi:hypothetical protein